MIERNKIQDIGEMLSAIRRKLQAKNLRASARRFLRFFNNHLGAMDFPDHNRFVGRNKIAPADDIHDPVLETRGAAGTQEGDRHAFLSDQFMVRFGA